MFGELRLVRAMTDEQIEIMRDPKRAPGANEAMRKFQEQVTQQLSQAVMKADQVTRMVLDDTYRNLVKEGLVKDTETNRREFINQAGNYNLRSQGQWMRLLRQSWFSPFATAGRNFATLGIRAVTLNPNMAAKWIGTATLVGTVNYLITGQLQGRKGTPLGAIDTGKNDENGRPKYFNVAAFTGQSRALRTVGARGAIEAARLGLQPSDMVSAAARDIVNVGLGATVGPGPKAAFIAATGRSPAVDVGRASAVAPPGDSQVKENVKAAILQANPILQSVYEANRPGGNASKAIERQLPRFTLTTGKSERLVENYPQIVEMAQSREFVDDVIHTARSLPLSKREAFVDEQILRLPESERHHAYQEVHRRKVFSQ